MTDEQVIDMAVQAGFKHPNPHDGYMGLAYDRRDGTDTGASLEAFAKLVAQHEREACAKICDSVNNYDNPMTANDVADAIRARGQA